MKKAKKILSCVVVGAICAALLAGCGESSNSTTAATTGSNGSSSEGTIKIGGLWSLTGWFDSYDTAGSKGFQLAVDEINAAGGIDGQQIEYVYYDTTSDLQTATSLTSKLIEQDNVAIMVGMCDPNTDIACGTLCQEAGIANIATASTLPYTQERVGDTAFLAAYGDNIQASAMAEYAYNELGCRTAYVVTNNTDEYTIALSKYFQIHFEALGGEILSDGDLGSEYDTNTSTDFSSIANQIKACSETPDCVFLGCFTDEGPLLLKQFREAGLDMPMLSGDGLDDLSVPEIAGDAANNTYYTTHVNYADSSTETFQKAYKEKYNEEPQSAFCALGYDTAYLIKYAIEKYADGDYSAASIRNALAKVTDFEGVTGVIDYSDGNVPNKTVYVNEYKDGGSENITSIVPTISDEEKDQ